MTKSAGTSRPTIVVTRPADDATRLVDALRGRGRDVLAMPVIGIAPVDDPARLVRAMTRVDDYRLVTFVSPNAIRHALAHRSAPWPSGAAIGVMGLGSVDALRTHGIAAPAVPVFAPARFDSEALHDLLVDEIGLGRGFDGRVLIVRGDGGNPWFADRLRADGIAVDEVESYRRFRPTVTPEAGANIRRHQADGAPMVFVMTSSEGVGHLVSMVTGTLPAGDEARAWLLANPVVASHPRIAEKARQAGFTAVSVCAPGDAGIVAAIE